MRTGATRSRIRPVDQSAQIRTERAPIGTGAYSQAIRAGDLVFISGQGPLDPATLEVDAVLYLPTR